jgi:hypothetical protein
MSITISLHLDTPDVSGDSLARHMAALGFTRPATVIDSSGPLFTAEQAQAEIDAAAELVAIEQPACALPSVLNEPSVIAKRERGKPGPGRKRRSAEEVAEDDAADRAEATPAAAPESTSDVSVLSVAPTDAAVPEIRANPENRGDPEDSAEVQAQDADDEAAEHEAAMAERLEKEPERVLTHDDLRRAMSEYVTKFGMPATLEDGPGIFKSALGNPPAGSAIWKLTLVPDDQAALGKTLAAWSAAVARAGRTKAETPDD